MRQLFFILIFLSSISLSATEPRPTEPGPTEPDWSEGFSVPPGGRSNPYNLSPAGFAASRERGRLAATSYPVRVTGILLPFNPIFNFLENPSPNPLYEVFQFFFKSITEIENFNSFLSWIGLHEFPKTEDTGLYTVPYPDGVRPSYLMGMSLIERGGVKGFTVGCAACHSSNLFGKNVLGLTNRFPRANRLFYKAKQAVAFADMRIFQASTGATDAETQLMNETLKNLNSIESKVPQQLGLDTSLAQVAIALSRRSEGPWIEKNPELEVHPSYEPLETEIADSKPAVWWNLKYKNRWLLDGSIVSGNPIFTNILWNELGRGADLHALDSWLSESSLIIQDLTTAIFSSEPPRITDFFDVNKIDIASARRGEVLFNQSCKDCHGQYFKAWSEKSNLPAIDLIKTLRVVYHSRTPVANVGTDPHRSQGMKSLEKLNALEISQKNKTLIRAQNGYVPPPLEGIWARWPYLHNASIPSLCALLTPGPQRPKIFYAREAQDPQADFDFSCNGYPVSQALTAEQKIYQYDTSREGLSNLGHDQNILIENGHEKFSAQDKRDLIQFLQTL